jgi:hypothetical protein
MYKKLFVVFLTSQVINIIIIAQLIRNIVRVGNKISYIQTQTRNAFIERLSNTKYKYIILV